MDSTTLEDVVALFEQTFAQHPGVKVTSRAHIPDKDSGNLREVDVLIQGVVGSVKVFCIVECRARRDPQDVQWIEQISAKRESVGAAVAIAVSSTGFTSGAIAKAKTKDIRLRKLAELSAEDLQRLIIPKVVMTQRRSKLLKVSLTLAAEASRQRASPGKAAFGGDLKEPLFFDMEASKKVNFLQVLELPCSSYSDFVQDLNLGSEERREANLAFDVPLRTVGFKRDRRRVWLTRVEMRLEVYEDRFDAKLLGGERYDIEDGRTAYRARYQALFNRRNFDFELVGEVLPAGEGWQVDGVAIRGALPDDGFVLSKAKARVAQKKDS